MELIQKYRFGVFNVSSRNDSVSLSDDSSDRRRFCPRSTLNGFIKELAEIPISKYNYFQYFLTFFSTSSLIIKKFRYALL